MNRRRLASLLVVLFLLAAPARAADRYEIDPAHTFVNFSIPHLVISRATGSFKDVAGVITYDAKDITRSSVEVTIKTAGIDTNNEGRDRHLRSADFFDAEKFPDITFKSRRVEKKGAGLVAVGDLTMHGTTREVSMPFTLRGPIKDPLPAGTMRLGVAATLQIDRRDFGITWSRALPDGGLFVGNEVTIDIHCEAVIPKPKAS